jgi:pre-rRNA-processing protein TSR2
MATPAQQSSATTLTPGSLHHLFSAHSKISHLLFPEQLQAKFDLGIWHTLFNWPILTIAIQNNWGGPDSADKRDWLAGAISEVFTSSPDTDTEDIEVILLQALEDEFGVRLEDESEVTVARDIFKIKGEVQRGELATVDALQKKWEERKGKEVKVPGNLQIQEGWEGDEGDSGDEETDSEDGDVEMGDAPELVPAKKEKAQPEVDEDGFEKVVGKRKAH